MPLSAATDAWLQKLQRKDFRLDLEPMCEACALFNHPQDCYPSIHIVGTNGKGSTAAFLSRLLTAAGYKTGLMTSPHLIDMRERIQMAGEKISWEALEELFRQIRHTLHDEDDLSFFETLTLAGFEYFATMGVDAAVVEAGMGGRFDATNVLKPQIAVFTPISFDHEKYLGDTLEKIAAEKCGILKPGMTVISAPQVQPVAKVLRTVCDQKNLQLLWADPSAVTEPLGLAGEHQKTNAAAALLATKVFLEQDPFTPPSPFGGEGWREGTLASTRWPGRLQYLQHNPAVLIDGAHNPAGIQTLADYLQKYHTGQKAHFLVGVLEDKNWKGMFAPLGSLAIRFVCVTPDKERGLPAAALASALQPLGVPVETAQAAVKSAYAELLSSLKPDDLLVATGSLYMLGELISCFPKPD